MAASEWLHHSRQAYGGRLFPSRPHVLEVTEVYVLMTLHTSVDPHVSLVRYKEALQDFDDTFTRLRENLLIDYRQVSSPRHTTSVN